MWGEGNSSAGGDGVSAKANDHGGRSPDDLAHYENLFLLWILKFHAVSWLQRTADSRILFQLRLEP